jgi:EKC/KEOPS complex subunit CGI121/TPRKB
VSETTTNLLVLKVATTPVVTYDSVSRHLSENIKGTKCAFEDDELQTMSDVARLKKVYKVILPNPGKVVKTANGDLDGRSEHMSTIEIQIIGTMALRGAT